MEKQVLKTETINGKEYDLVQVERSKDSCTGCAFIDDNRKCKNLGFAFAECWIGRKQGIFIPKNKTTEG